MKISTRYKTICDYCNKDLDYNQKRITLDCNDTGYSNDDYTLDLCNINCLKLLKEQLEESYSQDELKEFSSYYRINKYLNKDE